jgi:hypothetical protein
MPSHVRARTLLSSAALLLSLISATALGQGRGGDDVLPATGTESLEQELRTHRQLLLKLFKGELVADPTDKQHTDAIDFAARYATYRYTWNENREPGKVDALFRVFEDTLVSLQKGKPNTKKMIELFSKQTAEHALEVMQTRKPIARVNAARVLARLAELGQPDVADALVKTIDDKKQNDAVKYYAFKGLEKILSLTGPAAAALGKEREEKCTQTLLRFLDQQVNFAKDAPRDEIDGYRVLRREAIRALAQVHQPSLNDKERPALTLLKVAARDGFSPDPRLDERLEAAIGVARMKPELDKEYQPQYAAHQLALFVAAYANAYQNRKENSEEARAWKIHAARLGEALEAMKAQSKDAQVAKVVDQCVRLLARIEQGQDAQPFDLITWLDIQPTGDRLFKNVENSTVKPANRRDAETETPEKTDKPDKPEKSDKPSKPDKPRP